MIAHTQILQTQMLQMQIAQTTMTETTQALPQIISQPAKYTIAFIDPSVEDYLTLLNGLLPNIAVQLLNPYKDGFAQILQTLVNHPELTEIHIFSHGSPGHLYLGNEILTEASLDHYTEEALAIAARHPELPMNWVLYGCNLAQGEIGQAFLHKLQQLTGANIAASVSPTGHGDRSGNWLLETRLGAVEFDSILHPATMASYAGVLAVVTVTNTNNSGAGSLRDAIANARTGDTIAFSSSLANQTITLSSQLDIPAGKNLIIDGAAAAGLKISGNNATRILQLNSNVDFPTSLTVKNLAMVNGSTRDRGGAITTTHKANLTVENVTFSNNTADKGGGAIYSEYEGSLTVTGSKFTGNKATAGNDERGAGAIGFFGPGALKVTNSEFTGNKGINGGAINSLNGQLTIENSKFLNNDVSAATVDNRAGALNPTLRGYGGAIFTDRANNNTTIKNSVFDNNISRSAGGALYLFNDPEDVVTIENSSFKGNQATGLPGGEMGAGGAIDHVRNSKGSGSLTLRNTAFVDNYSAGSGGGVWINQTNSTITNTTFSGNRTAKGLTADDYVKNGGALALFSNASANLTNVTFALNHAGWVGGAIVAASDASVSLKNTIFDRNTADNGTNTWNIQQHVNRTFTDQGGNIQYPPSDVSVASGARSVDPKLGALQQSGNFWFHPLLSGSPAINTGVSGAPLTDLLGFTRDSQPDVGAVEFGSGSSTLPSLRVNDVQVTEGNSGSQNAVFTVTLSGASTQTVKVNYATANNTATAGSDYTSSSGTLTFNPGDLTKTIAIPVLGDTAVEANESFFLNLSGASNATISDSQGLGTIVNNDTATANPSLSINNVTLTEGNLGTKNAVFTVKLSAASTKAISVNYATANGTATAGSDYTTKTGKLTFNAGELSKTISIAITGDTQVEANETFSVNLSSPTNATLGTSKGTATLTNDDSTSPKLSINNVRITEGNAGTKNAVFTVSLAAATSKTVALKYATANGQAIAGSDYNAISGNLSFNPGETRKTISVPIRGDGTVEGDESFYVNLTNLTNATFAVSRGTGTIVNDDTATAKVAGASALRSTALSANSLTQPSALQQTDLLVASSGSLRSPLQV
ncbi:Calx-beta domain-containing protein [Alkalinema pantanalense CENA528]|uniref:Calx-beta domain-containing protein n=1 Tax=Alkalinema pantanalense TaxID=1620705 RepID=UPI003D6F4BEC